MGPEGRRAEAPTSFAGAAGSAQVGDLAVLQDFLLLIPGTPTLFLVSSLFSFLSELLNFGWV